MTGIITIAVAMGFIGCLLYAGIRSEIDYRRIENEEDEWHVLFRLLYFFFAVAKITCYLMEEIHTYFIGGIVWL